MEDLEGQIKKPTSEMSPEELQFHYFKVHDYNNDNRLDGIELISALTHHSGNASLLLLCCCCHHCRHYYYNNDNRLDGIQLISALTCHNGVPCLHYYCCLIIIIF